MVRIITGKAKGQKLEVPKHITRPLTDRIKTSIFDSIQHIIPNSRVLDLFAGSGNFGIEALSRGANTATFIDNSELAINIIKQNLSVTKLSNQANIIKSTVRNFAKTSEELFDIVFVDPPFPVTPDDKNATFKILPKICKDSSIVIVRIPSEETLLDMIGKFKLLHHDNFGVSTVGYYGVE